MAGRERLIRYFFICAHLIAAIAQADVEDVREVLSYYQKFENPLAQFRDNQRKLYEQMQEKEIEDKSRPVAPVKKWTPSFLSK